DRLTGFGCRVQPSGTKSFIVNYRAGDGGRKAPNRRVVIGRYGRVGPDEARRKARDMLGQVARVSSSESSISCLVDFLPIRLSPVFAARVTAAAGRRHDSRSIGISCF
ncbi:MAG: DUF4102 domain-containing protein, partial [Boseongicola sp. SB0677_bin_26]|nr:DUF4102 domain-containing protein [Boseongicola sp. SB0677_bin_26]